MTKVLVTGAGGFIGSHVTEALVRSGYQVKALVHYNSEGSSGWLSDLSADVAGEVEVAPGDVTDESHVRKLLRDCQGVAHLASLIGIPYSYEAPRSYVDTNVRGTLNVLQAARDLSLEMVVHTSTSEVYGTAQQVPMSESHPLNAQSPYAATKIAADQLALSFHRSFGLPVTVLRPFNTFGPRQSVRAVIPAIITQMLWGQGVLKLGRTDTRRDLTFVHDTASAFVRAMQCQSAVGKVLNLGTGTDVSIASLVKTIAQQVNWAGDVEVEEVRLRPEASEVHRLVSDNSAARRELNWQPAFVGDESFGEAIRQTVVWWEQRSPDVRRLLEFRR